MRPKSTPTKVPFQVFGLWLVVRIQNDHGTRPEVHCPKGGTIVHGEVVTSGDGYDPEAARFRPMPPPGTVVVLEETEEDVEGHYFYLNEQEFRVVHLDSIIINFLNEAE